MLLLLLPKMKGKQLRTLSDTHVLGVDNLWWKCTGISALHTSGGLVEKKHSIK